MKRDMDVVRDILIAVEEKAPVNVRDELRSLPPERSYLAGYTSPEVADRTTVDGVHWLVGPAKWDHANLLIDEGYVKHNPYEHCQLVILTWKGHDLLESIRDDNVWKQVKKKIEAIGGSVSLVMVKSIAENVTKGVLSGSYG